MRRCFAYDWVKNLPEGHFLQSQTQSHQKDSGWPEPTQPCLEFPSRAVSVEHARSLQSERELENLLFQEIHQDYLLLERPCVR
jgi:hypothetical protein